MQLIDSTIFNNLCPTNPMMGDRLLEKVDKFFHSMEPRWDKLETSLLAVRRSRAQDKCVQQLTGRDFRLRARDHGSRVAAKR